MTSDFATHCKGLGKSLQVEGQTCRAVFRGGGEAGGQSTPP